MVTTSAQSDVAFVRKGFEKAQRYADTMAHCTFRRQLVGAQDGFDESRSSQNFAQDESHESTYYTAHLLTCLITRCSNLGPVIITEIYALTAKMTKTSEATLQRQGHINPTRDGKAHLKEYVSSLRRFFLLPRMAQYAAFTLSVYLSHLFAVHLWADSNTRLATQGGKPA